MSADPIPLPSPSLSSVKPRLATPRDLSRPSSNIGAFIAQCFGRRWLPWQTEAAGVLNETLPDGSMAYPIGVIMVPRQVGKSTWVFDDLLGRIIEQPDYRAAYTAQTAVAASERFGERLSALPQTILADYLKGRRSQGSERITVSRPVGHALPGAIPSFVRVFPPRDGALRGSALDEVVIDEAQEVGELEGTALDQTILPTFTTRPRRQLILVGTAGNDASKYLARYLALARGGAAGVAVVEYGATEDDDYEDPAVWRRVHPGLAAGLTDEAALRSALQVMGAESFGREYLCVWTDSGNRLINTRTWNRCRRVKARPRAGVAPVIAFDVAFDRSATAIVGCWPDLDGVPVLEVIAYEPGTDWAAGRLDELRRNHRPPLVVAPNEGPALTIVDELRRKGWTSLRQTTPPEYAAACMSTYDDIERAGMGHRNEQPLNAAVSGAGKRPSGDGGWVWSRRTSTADISPLTAGSLAHWGNQRRPARPMVDA